MGNAPCRGHAPSGEHFASWRLRARRCAGTKLRELEEDRRLGLGEVAGGELRGAALPHPLHEDLAEIGTLDQGELDKRAAAWAQAAPQLLEDAEVVLAIDVERHVVVVGEVDRARRDREVERAWQPRDMDVRKAREAFAGDPEQAGRDAEADRLPAVGRAHSSRRAIGRPSARSRSGDRHRALARLVVARAKSALATSLLRRLLPLRAWFD
jgi:hypothetical protein